MQAACTTTQPSCDVEAQRPESKQPSDTCGTRGRSTLTFSKPKCWESGNCGHDSMPKVTRCRRTAAATDARWRTARGGGGSLATPTNHSGWIQIRILEGENQMKIAASQRIAKRDRKVKNKKQHAEEWLKCALLTGFSWSTERSLLEERGKDFDVVVGIVGEAGTKGYKVAAADARSAKEQETEKCTSQGVRWFTLKMATLTVFRRM